MKTAEEKLLGDIVDILSEHQLEIKREAYRAGYTENGKWLIDNKAAHELYVYGYRHGHHDTVEGSYLDILHHDKEPYFSEEVAEFLAALKPRLPMTDQRADELKELRDEKAKIKRALAGWICMTLLEIDELIERV